MARIQKFTTCLWFDDQAEEAARYYTGIFKNSKIERIARYGEGGQEIHERPPGSVMIVEFELKGQPFTALNGGPQFKFNEAISFQINCETQEEVDYYWEQALRGRRPEGAAVRLAQGQVRRCPGRWCRRLLEELMTDPDPDKAGAGDEAMLKMKKLDIAELKRAAA